MTKNIVSYYTFDYFYKTEVLKKDAEEMEKPFSLTGLPLQDLGPYRSSPSCSRSAIVRGSEHRLVIQCCGLLSLCPVFRPSYDRLVIEH